MDNTFNFFRIKTEWTSELSDGSLQKMKTEDLVYAVNYTDAEKVAHEIAKDQERGKLNSYNVEIVKTKISELLYNDYLCQDSNLIAGLICNFFSGESGADEGLYSVKVIFIEEDEKSGKEKKSTTMYYVPATSGIGAHNFVEKYIQQQYQNVEYLIREVKFDKAESILWSQEVHQQKVDQFDNRY